MRCRKLIEPDPKKQHVVNRCGKKARVFFRISYSALRWRTDVTEEIVGFCDDCSPGMDVQKNWRDGWKKGCVVKLRGTVGTIESCSEPEAVSSRDETQRKELKDAFKRVFAFKKNEKVSPEEWESIFSDSLHEYIVSQVQGS